MKTAAISLKHAIKSFIDILPSSAHPHYFKQTNTQDKTTKQRRDESRLSECLFIIWFNVKALKHSIGLLVHLFLHL